MKNEQKGFVYIEGLLILVIVGLISFVGWYVWHSKQVTNALLTSATSISSSTPTLKSKARPLAQTAPANATASTPTTAPQTTTTPVSTSKVQPPTVVIHPTSQDIEQAKSQASAIQSLIEAYQANYATYTWDLTPSPLINQPGVSGASESTFVAPAGTSFSYKCMKGGGPLPTCSAYQLQVLQSNGTVIETLKDQF